MRPRPFTVIDADQRSAAWRAARCGRLTASRAKDILAKIKSNTGESAARRDYRLQLATERVTKEPQDNDFVNADMQRGIELESAAFAAYEAVTGQLLDRCGFVAHNELLIGCSPDGVVEDFTGVVELKVPRSATHLRYLRSGGVPAEHAAQITHTLWVTGAEYCDFLSYDPRFPTPLQTYYVRVLRNEAALAAYATQAMTFLDEVAQEVEAVRQMAAGVV